MDRKESRFTFAGVIQNFSVDAKENTELVTNADQSIIGVNVKQATKQNTVYFILRDKQKGTQLLGCSRRWVRGDPLRSHSDDNGSARIVQCNPHECDAASLSMGSSNVIWRGEKALFKGSKSIAFSSECLAWNSIGSPLLRSRMVLSQIRERHWIGCPVNAAQNRIGAPTHVPKRNYYRHSRFIFRVIGSKGHNWRIVLGALALFTPLVFDYTFSKEGIGFRIFANLITVAKIPRRLIKRAWVLTHWGFSGYDPLYFSNLTLYNRFQNKVLVIETDLPIRLFTLTPKNVDEALQVLGIEPEKKD